MLAQFIATTKRLLHHCSYPHRRYLMDRFEINGRLTGLIGPRGTGKTTLMLQTIQDKIEDPDRCIYLSLDHIYFNKHDLIVVVQDLIERYHIRYFFLDEVHKYADWNQVLKNIYDSFPDVFVVFSGSSSIDLIKGSYDLSRRAVLYALPGMSFREYLLFHGVAEIPAISLKDLTRNPSVLDPIVMSIPKLRGHFRDYLGHGYHPFSLEDKATYQQKLLRVLDKTIYEDISHFYSLKTGSLANIKKILVYLATIPPGNLNRNNIAKHMGLDHKTVHHYLSILAETTLIQLISTLEMST
jgi:predicted AAA+ superfamily ATPase